MASPGIDRAVRLRELAQVFLKLGATAFGGPAAHIGMLEQEVVRRRQWLKPVEFLDLLSAANLIPGPNSTELAIHIGLRRAGYPGLLIAGVCFVLPAMLIVMGLAWAYVRYGALPEAGALMYGLKPVVMAIVLHALWNLGRRVVTSVKAATTVVLAVAANVFGLHELILLLATGLVFVGLRRSSASMSPGSRGGRSPLTGAWVMGGAAGTSAAVVAATPASVSGLFLFFLKVGSVLYGSGYVLLAFLRADLVERWGWLSEGQLIDAVAVGQFTPGPLFTTATFIGYVLEGPAGAMVSTVGIFLPAFLFVAISGPIIPRLRQSPTASAFLDGVNLASLALMGVVTARLGWGAIQDVWSGVLFGVAFVLLARYRLNSMWLLLGGAVTGLVLRLLIR